VYPELIFGIVGPIGVNVDLVCQRLGSALKSVGYEPQVLQVTQLMKSLPPLPVVVIGDTLYERKIAEANLHRSAHGDAVMAALAVSEIRNIRELRLKSSANSQATDQMVQSQKTAYIIRQLKRPEEIDFLRKIYGRKFVQVSATLDKDTRQRNLAGKLTKLQPELPNAEEKSRELIARDEDETLDDHGQQIVKAFHTADVFINALNEDTIARTTLRFIEAFFGKNSISPTKDEFGSYLAKTASLRTVDLSRQVGAAILNECGDVVSIGCNEVPKSGGGNYWGDDAVKARDIDNDSEGNKPEINRIVHDFLSKLSGKGVFLEEMNPKKIMEMHSETIADALISDITEFGRMTHAEMSSICDAARLGRALLGTTMYVTTFPCHNCAKHIVASGIDRVVFIEPYAKSRAEKLHSDAISIGSRSEGKVHFCHFEGISPRKYRDIFEKGKRRNKDGTIREWDDGVPVPRVDDNTPIHVQKELFALDEVFKRIPEAVTK
jgi:deoxycytidylate deaminase